MPDAPPNTTAFLPLISMFSLPCAEFAGPTILCGMSIAITEDHQALAETVDDFLQTRKTRLAARALLDGAEETLPEFWKEIADLGWLGLHIPGEVRWLRLRPARTRRRRRGVGRGLAPGSFIPTVIASAVDQRRRHSPR